MGASESFLSSSDYGYDYVLAVTQDSINSTALAFLSSRQPTISVCYVYDDNGDPKRIDYAAFKKSAGGADPFDVPASGPERDAALKRIDDAGFMFGFQAAMGLPEGFAPASLPAILTLGSAPSDPVLYRLLCRTFQLVEMKPIPRKPSVFETFAQPKGPAGEPWVFTYSVPRTAAFFTQRDTDVEAFMRTSTFAGLPAAAQQKLSGNPGAFSIQQLLFNFAQASVAVRPQISGVSRVLAEKLYEDFAIAYFTEMQDATPPVVALLPRRDDQFGSLQTEFSLNLNPANPPLACLNYLCAVAGHPLPAPKQFSWDWVETSEADAFDGVCVINRNQLVERLRLQLADYVARNKWLPHPVEVEVYFTKYWADFGVMLRSSWHGELPDNLDILADSLDAPAAGDVLLHWQYHIRREYDYLSGTSWMLGETAFELKVTCAGNTLVVEQHALVYCKLVMVTFSRHEWDLVDLTITDTFTLATQHDGTLTATRTSKTVDASSTIGDVSLVPDLKARFERIQADVKNKLKQTAIDIPLSVLDGLIFPGGRAFMFKAVSFSDHQDLVAHITYADPS